MGDRQEVTAEKMAAGGDALAHLGDGRVVFVDGALPGERVVVDVHTSKKDFARARVLDVLDPSLARVAPPCPAVAAGCGGCGWQHVDPAAQLGLKTDVVREAFARTARMPSAVVTAGASVPAWGYRTTLRLAVAPNGRVGLRAAASHRVVELADCPVAHPLLAGLLPGLRVRGADEVTVRVSVATGEVTALPSAAGAVVDGLPDGAGVGPAAVLHETVAGVPLRVSATSFFQSGPAAAELLVATVRAALADAPAGGRFLDAYGGVGLLAATGSDGPVVLVESAASSCADAAVNLGERATIVPSPFERWQPQPVDVAVADPARAGLGKEGAAVLAATGAPRLVLVSCDPVAAARDAALLAGLGYRHVESTVLDLFPQTHHVEVVTRFARGTGD
ncbi:MAG: class I SAM-dependent RNA methyltransferase [Acidimicrobiaceae bacterium]|nr:class I SAM-dependent RNA methyltransferase [Ilumatobacter sp.]MCB9382146.1 class I SAM-dependent RNA methyltransferase [Acidimicrobiaceae bacterium]